MIGQKICDLPEGYEPSSKEEFMNDYQREYFRRKLESWKQELLAGADELRESLKENSETLIEDADRASSETSLAYTLRSKDRARKLVIKIDQALKRIEDKTYGYCEETGEPISLERLKARPVATLSLEAQKRHEKEEKERNCA